MPVPARCLLPPRGAGTARINGCPARGVTAASVGAGGGAAVWECAHLALAWALLGRPPIPLASGPSSLGKGLGGLCWPRDPTVGLVWPFAGVTGHSWGALRPGHGGGPTARSQPTPECPFHSGARGSPPPDDAVPPAEPPPSRRGAPALMSPSPCSPHPAASPSLPRRVSQVGRAGRPAARERAGPGRQQEPGARGRC